MHSVHVHRALCGGSIIQRCERDIHGRFGMEDEKHKCLRAFRLMLIRAVTLLYENVLSGAVAET